MQKANWQNGDIIKMTCRTMPMCIHFGILYRDEKTGDWFVMHNTPSQNSVSDTLDEFSRDREFLGTEKSKLSGLSSSQLIQTFKENNIDYDSLYSNCEDFIVKMGAKTFTFQQNHVFFSLVGISLLLTTALIYRYLK